MTKFVKQLSRKKSPDNVTSINDAEFDDDISYPTKYSDYNIYGLIGKGAFANVYAGIIPSLNDTQVAIKVINFESDTNGYNDDNKSDPLIEIQKEVKVMSQLRHNNIVRSFISFVVYDELWLIMPYLSGGSCADIISYDKYKNGLKNENILSIIFKDILMGIQYIHKDNNRMHRDIKCRNILINKHGIAKLADFGVSGALVENGLRKKGRNTLTGTPCWMSPEVIKHENYNYKADIWSFGITMLELAFGTTPYTKFKSPMKVMIQIMEKDPPTVDSMDKKNKFSKHFKSFVSKCLVRDLKKRSSASELLTHNFIKNVKDSYRKLFLDEVLKDIVQQKNINNIRNNQRPESITKIKKQQEQLQRKKLALNQRNSNHNNNDNDDDNDLNINNNGGKLSKFKVEELVSDNNYDNEPSIDQSIEFSFTVNYDNDQQNTTERVGRFTVIK